MKKIIQEIIDYRYLIAIIAFIIGVSLNYTAVLLAIGITMALGKCMTELYLVLKIILVLMKL